MGDAYRQWRSCGDTSELLEMIVVEFRVRSISEQCAFVDMAAQWRESYNIATTIAEAKQDDEMRRLECWFDEGDKTSLLAGLFLPSVTGEPPSTATDCRLLATDFICLRPNEWLNASVMDAGLNTICNRTNAQLPKARNATISNHSWTSLDPATGRASVCKQLMVAKTKGNNKVIMSLNSNERQWFGVFLDISQDVIAIKIYNSLGHRDTEGSATVHNLIEETLAPLS
jgi:Ulp1 family protease